MSPLSSVASFHGGRSSQAVVHRFCATVIFVIILACTCASPALADAESGSGISLEIAAFDSKAIKPLPPQLFYSAPEIKSAKLRIKNDPDAREIFERFLEKVDESLEIEMEPFNSTWWDKIKDKPWSETYPEIHEYTLREPQPYAQATDNLTLAWSLTGEKQYLDKAIETLVHLADYPFEAEHFDVGLSYSVWVLHAFEAYSLLWPQLDVEQRQNIDAFFTRFARAVAENDIYWIENEIGGGVNNHLAWHKMSLGLLGLFYDRPELVEFCLHGPKGLVALLEDGLLDHGLWRESSLNYHFTAIVPMVIFADAQKRIGQHPSLADMTLADGRTLKQPYDAMFDVLSAEGSIPPIGDAYGYIAKLWNTGLYERAWRLWEDPDYAWLLRQKTQPNLHMLFVPPLPEREDLTPPSIKSILLPEHGYAFLRFKKETDYWHSDARCALLNFGRSDVHCHWDRLSLILFGQKTQCLSDVEGRATVPHAFSSKIQRELNRGGLSQNTVMIDGRDQSFIAKPLKLIEYRDLAAEKRVTAADLEGDLYKNVRQMRTIAMTEDYVLDVFQVNSGARKRQIDWIMHVLDRNAEPDQSTNGLIQQAEVFELPDEGAWKWLRDGRVLGNTGDLKLGWRNKKAHVRLFMLDPQADKVIHLGYPETDQPDARTVPMLIVRKNARSARFVACWVLDHKIEQLEIRELGRRDKHLLYEVRIDNETSVHRIPALDRW